MKKFSGDLGRRALLKGGAEGWRKNGLVMADEVGTGIDTTNDYIQRWQSVRGMIESLAQLANRMIAGCVDGRVLGKRYLANHQYQQNRDTNFSCRSCNYTHGLKPRAGIMTSFASFVNAMGRFVSPSLVIV